MELSTLYQLFLNCTSVTTDSRNTPAGSMFFALKGDSFNGNRFALQALNAGSAYAVIDEEEYAVENDERFIKVNDVLLTLQQLANHHRKVLNTRLIGITGTNGKTTTKELIAAVLSKKYNVLYTTGNLNNHIGVPLTLLRLKKEHGIAVVEIGANHPGEIKMLAEIARPNYGIITNVGKAHLEGFGSFEGVVKTKGELYDYLRQNKESVAFVHHDNPWLMETSNGLNRVFYGTGNSLYVNGSIESNSPFLGFKWKQGENGNYKSVTTRLIGSYNFFNALAAVTIGSYFQIDPNDISEALSEYTPQNNRSQLKKTDSNTLIIDAYNANPTSMMAALENFKNMEAEHKVVILGDMKELGTDSEKEHQKIIDYLEECDFEEVILVGEVFSEINKKYTSYTNVQEVINIFQLNKPEGKTMLIKGSNGIKLGLLADYL